MAVGIFGGEMRRLERNRKNPFLHICSEILVAGVSKF
jgi:hypothetical protein